MPARTTWGGARNRADRESWHLTRQQVDALIAAAAFAERIGLAFNRHWTIHYERAGIDDSEGRQFIGRLVRLVGTAARRAGGELAAIWVRENGEGKGAHVHILLHLPDGFALRNRTRRWIRLAGGIVGAIRARVSKVRSIGGRLDFATLANEPEASAHYRINADIVCAYLLKGASAETGLALGLPRSGEGAPIIGKRCGWTENIGAAARKRASR